MKTLYFGTLGVCLLALIAITCFSVVSASSDSAIERTSGSGWKQAQFCCKGCQYESSCCCGLRGSLPVKTTKYKKTVTSTIVKLKTITARKKVRDVSIEEPTIDAASDEPALGLESVIDTDESHSLFARHLCPVCPKGAKVAPAGSGKNNGGGYNYCCAARKTVTVTINKTLTKRKTTTKTVTAARKVTMTGRVWYDLNKNDIWDGIPTDLPISNTVVFLLKPVVRGRAVSRADATPLGNTTTDSLGAFKMGFDPQTPGTPLTIVKDLVTREPLVEFTASSNGGAPDALIPVPRPAAPIVQSTDVTKNIATVKGTGTPGLDAFLLCDDKPCGDPVPIQSDGSFTLLSTWRHSGTHKLSVGVIDKAGRESDLTPADNAVIVPPPSVTSTTLKGRNAVIVGKGTPGAILVIYDKTNTSVGSTTVANDGSWQVEVFNLPDGTHPFAATQEDVHGISDPMDAGSVTLAPPPAPIWVKTTLKDGNIAVVQGKGQAGATIDLYEGATKLGSTTVNPDGTFVVESYGLAVGPHPLTIKQVNDIGSSAAVNAKSVTVVQPPPNPPTWTATGLTLDNKGQVNGTCTPGATVKVYANATFSAQGPCGQDGKFSITTPVLQPALHTFSIDQQVNGLSSTAVSAGSVTVIVPPPTPVAVDYTNGFKGRVNGTGVAGMTIELLDVNDNKIGQATVGPDSKFVVESINDMPSGTNPVKIRQVVTNGAKSVTVPAGNVVIPPTVTGSTVDAGTGKGKVTGKGKPGAMIKLYDESNAEVGTTTVDGSGNYIVFTNNVLSPGTYPYKVTQTDLSIESGKIAAPNIVVLATSTSATKTATQTKSSSTLTKTATTTKPCRTAPPVYNGSALPFREWPVDYYYHYFWGVEASADGSEIFMCGEFYDNISFDNNNATSGGAAWDHIGGVLKVNAEGTIQWFKHWDAMMIIDCKLASDGALWVIGQGYLKTTIVMDTFSFPRITPGEGSDDWSGVAGHDVVYARLNASTGAVLYAKSVGNPGSFGTQIECKAGLIAPITNGGMIISGWVKDSAKFSDVSTKTCSYGGDLGCPFVAKVTKLGTVAWSTIIDNVWMANQQAGVVSMANGTRVYVHVKNRVLELDGSNGNILRTKNYTGNDEVYPTLITLVGDNLYVASESGASSVTMDSVTLTKNLPGSGQGFIFKMSLASFTATAGISMQTDSSGEYVDLESMELGYNGTSAEPDSLVVSFGVEGLNFFVGSTNTTIQSASNKESVAVVARLSLDTLEMISWGNLGGKTIFDTTADRSGYGDQTNDAISIKNTGQVLQVGRIGTGWKCNDIYDFPRPSSTNLYLNRYARNLTSLE